MRNTNFISNLINLVKKEQAWAEKEQVETVKTKTDKTDKTDKAKVFATFATFAMSKNGAKSQSLKSLMSNFIKLTSEWYPSEGVHSRYCLDNVSITARQRLDNGSITARQRLDNGRTALRYVAMITLLLTLVCGEMWGTDFTPAQIVTSGGTTTDHIKVSTDFSTITNKQFCSSESGLTGVNVNGSAGGTYSSSYVEIAAQDGYTLSTCTLKVASSGTSAGTEAVAFWNGDASATTSSVATFTAPANNNSSCANTIISVPSGTKTIRLYRKISISNSDGKTFASGSKTDYGGSQTYYMFGITATASAAGTTWYVKGSFDSWGSGFNFTGSGTELTATVNITTAGLYEFKINNTDGNAWYGNGGNIGCNVSGWVFSTDASNCRFFASETGNYTFTFNTSTKALSVTYPTAQGKYYYKNTGSWGTVTIYRYVGGINNGWPGTQVVETETVCGDTYYFTYADPGTTLIFNNNNGGSQTGNMTTSGNAGKYVQGTESSWRTFPTYTVAYDGNGNTGGSVPTDASSPYACGSTVTVLGNTGSLEKSGYTFNGWNTAANGSGTPYAADATFTISANTTLYAQWEEISCPSEGTLYSAVTTATGNISITAGTSNLTLNTSTHKTTVTGGSMSVYNAQGSNKNLITSSGFCMTNGNTYFRIDLDCELEAGDVISVDVGKDGSNERGVWITTATSRPGSAPACALTATNASLVPITYTVTGSDAYHGNSTFYIYRATDNTSYFNNINITRTAACGATQPGAISKSLSACTLTLTADGSPASNNTWYWQTAADGTATNLGTGATKNVTEVGTYYIRSYYSTGTCWSEAQSITVSASDLIPAAPTALAAASTTAKGTTLTVTDAANTNDYEFYVSTSSTAPTSGTSASYTVTSGKSKTITDKYAGTTFYAWARAKCGSNKSDWTALTGNTFTTSTVSVTHTLTNVTKTSGATSGVGGSTYTAVYSANTGYSMPTPTVTIGGNTATSGTDYTWTSGTGTLTIPANKITGDIVITLNSVPHAPTSATISGAWHYFPGENISLTVTPTGNNGPTTYQWYKGGKADGNAISGATSATYTKNACAYEDAGSYYCKVTCNGTSIWANTNSSENYDVKILRLYIKTGRNGTDEGNVDFTKVDGTTATATFSMGSNWDYGFNIADGCGHYYGNTGTMTEGNCTDWTMNVDGTDCLMRTTNAATYTFTVNYSNLAAPVVSITYPSGNQAAGKVIYFDNNDRQWTNVYFRIGRSDHNQSSAMTKVYGTANLYQFTTTEYNGFSGWHITNAAGGTGSGKSIYNTVNTPAITKATAHEGAAVTAVAVTVTPTTSRGNGADVGVNDNCEFYNYTIASGMKTQNVSITAPSNGTITVSYTDVNNAAQSFTSGNRDLAHTVIITPTATPATGYQLGGLTVNGAAHTSGNTYTVTGTTIVAATFSLIDYTVTLHTNGGTINAGNVTSYNYGTGATLPTNVTKTGYTFDGWYDNSGLTGSAVTTISSSATGNKEFWAKWTIKTTTITIDANTANHGSTTPGTVTATWGSALPSFTAAAPATPDGYQLKGYYTAATGGTKVINVNGTLVASTDYADGSGNWKYETSTLTLYAQYEAKTFTITYLDDDESTPISASPTSYTYGVGVAELPTPTKSGYNFVGWYSQWCVEEEHSGVYDAECIRTEIETTDYGDVTYIAKWTVAPTTEDIYYGQITITAGALTKGNTGTKQFFTNTGGTIANTTAISWESNPSDAGYYYESNDLTHAELIKSSHWTTSSSSNRYVRAVKFGSGNTYTLQLGTKVATSIKFYGKCGGTSKTLAIGGQSWTSNATKNTHEYHEFTKSGNFTGDVSMVCGGDFYGIIVVSIQTATPCTTPVIPSLSDQTVCPGDDIAAWNATQTASLADGETASYSWKKKGSDTELATTASFDLGSSATESQAGTYVVTVTVSKAGKASSTASAEVDLTVIPATEEPSVSQSPAKAQVSKSVTLTATCGSTGTKTWSWHTCNSDGTGESSAISGATTNAYTFTAPAAAGTYYYKVKVTGDGTNACGTASHVYALTVAAASECTDYFWFVYADDATSNGVTNNEDSFFSGTKTGSSNQSSYKFTLDGTEYTATRNTGSSSISISFTIPTGATATLAMNAKSSSSNTITLTHSSGTPSYNLLASGSYTSVTKEDIGDGTWTLTAASNWTLCGLGVHVCSTSSCTDAIPAATAAATTVCSGSELSIAATGYETSPTSIQWQKLNGSTWDNISDATSDTYTVASAAASDAGSYRVVVTKGCARTSNTVTIAVPSVPDFGSTVPASVSIMQTLALSINDVEATDAVKYRWYKSADDTWDAGDTEIGTNQSLVKAYADEAIGSPSYYIFCRAQNACGITTSSAIAVNVTTYIEEDCATRGNEGEAEFDFDYGSAGQGSYSSTACWTMNDNSKILTYTAPEGKYFKTAKVTIASSNQSSASYNWSTNGGSTYTAVALTVNSTLTERTINLSAHGNVDKFQIGRNFNSTGASGGTLYVSKICFEYTESCTSTTVTVSPTSKTYTIGDSWTAPTITLTGTTGTLTYSSSNEDIATVDDDGTVTFQDRAGTVTITASYAGDGTYCASEGSYTITVSCSGGAPKVVVDGSTNMSGCNSSITLHAKNQSDADFVGGSYQWFRDEEEISGATSKSYTAVQAGHYTVEYTTDGGCTSSSSNAITITSETTEPEVERLVPFQYYHVDKTYTDQMKMRHLFAVKNSGKLDGKSFKLYVSRNGGAATDVTSSNALAIWTNADGRVDTVMIDLNKLSGKYSENDELVFTCKAIDCSGNVSETYKDNITMHVIGSTPTLALICSGSDEANGTRETKKLKVGGDFLTGYNKADLCEQTDETSFDPSSEWGLYTELKGEYIVTPVNGYAEFYKLNYEPFDILFLTDYPKSSKSEAAQKIIDDMSELCDYRPLFSFKTHFQSDKFMVDGHFKYNKWTKKGFTTAPQIPKQSRLHLNIVCYAHPMFNDIKEKSGTNVQYDYDDTHQIVYKMLTEAGYETHKKVKKGMQGFEVEAAENFVTIGLVHYDAGYTDDYGGSGNIKWSPNSEDMILVAAAERQTNIEARMILFSLNAGAHSKLTETGEQVVLKCLEYLLDDDPLHVADCSFTFDNGEGYTTYDEAAYHAAGHSGYKGDGNWSTPANWGPDRVLIPGVNNDVRIEAPVTVDIDNAEALSVRLKEGGSIIIPAGSALEVKSTIRRIDGTEISPTENSDIFIGSTASGNGTLIFNNDKGDSKATVAMYTTAKADIENMSAATSTWQYIGTPHNDVISATYNYYDSWLYQYDTSTEGWVVIPNGGPLVPFRGYCVTHPQTNHTFEMYGKLAATTSADIAIPAGKFVVAANSWVAPIDLNKLTDDDMENITDKTIYFFNTGSDAEQSNGTGTAPGTYVAAPIHASAYTGDWQIPSMQGFYVVGGGSDGTLHLDYDRHVRPTESRSIVSNPMHAPRRYMESDEPEVAKLYFRGSRYSDRLVVLEREDFTRGYDSGWDGEAWGGNDAAPYSCVSGENRWDAVSAIPDFEGTVVGFQAGEDHEYIIDFEYSEENEPLYLLDTDNNTYTQVVTGNAYQFTTDDKDYHDRFIFTRKGPQIATGIEPTSDSSLKGRARKLLIEDKMYILLNGMLYDATGKVVK